MWQVSKVLKLGSETIAGIAIFFITMQEEWQNFEIVVFNNSAGLAPRFLVISHIFFEYCIRHETIFPHLIKTLLKAFGKTKF